MKHITHALVLCGWFAMTHADAASASPVQVWNVERWQTVCAGDFSGLNPALPTLKPIAIMGTRNGVASGAVVMTRDGAAIRGIKAAVGDLTQASGGGSILSARVQVRFADAARVGKSWMTPERFDRLLESAPAEVPAADVKAMTRTARHGWGRTAFTPKSDGPVATLPVWVTVRIPADARPGRYAGSLTLEAESLVALRVPLELTVHDWKAPDPKDFKVRTIGWMNPEALAKHYEVALWTPRHFELMGQSMERMLELGSRHLAIDVGQNFPARDNADTMIKWVKRPDGKYSYDFTLFDQYCDLAAKKIGKPFPVRLNLWRGPKNGGGGESTNYPHTRVLMIDPATNAPVVLMGPTMLGSAEMQAFWKPVMDEMRLRLDKRGWFDVTGINWMCYCGGMTKELASMVKSIWPDAKWTDVTHSRVTRYATLEPGVFAPVFVQSTVWNGGSVAAYQKWTEGPFPRQYAGKLKPDTAWCTHARNQYGDNASLWRVRTIHEDAILKGNDGLECVGADHFPSRDARGSYRPGIWSDFAQGPKNATMTMLGAGDEGPVGTERFEAMREGIQLCEAMIFVQKAIEAGKLSGDLLARANRLLDDRARAFVACVAPTGVRNKTEFDTEAYAKDAWVRDDALYAMAAEVARAVQ